MNGQLLTVFFDAPCPECGRWCSARTPDAVRAAVSDHYDYAHPEELCPRLSIHQNELYRRAAVGAHE